MNGFRFIGSSTIDQLDPATLLYSLLLSRVDSYADGDIIAVSSVSYDRLENFKFPELDKSLDDLVDRGFIEEFDENENTYFKVGEWKDPKNIVLLPDINSLGIKKDKDLVKELHKEAVKVHRSFRGKLDNISWFFRDDTPNTPELVEFFNTVSCLHFMETPRNPQSKEFGQMKNLARLYSPGTLCSMIIHYITNSEDYGAAFPSIGGLSVHKDKVKFALSPSKNLKTVNEDDLRF